MTDKNYTDITLVLDRSGSMSSMRDEPIGAVNAFIEDQKKVEGWCVCTVVLFDNQYEFLHRAVSIQDIPPLTGETYQPRGSTALLDAVGRASAETKERIAGLDEDKKPDKVIFVILTDGMENASKEWTREKMLEVIKEQTDDHNWSYVYLGVDISKFSDAQAMGVFLSNRAVYDSHTKGALRGAVCNVSANVSNYRSTGIGGQSLGTTTGDVVVGEEND